MSVKTPSNASDKVQDIGPVTAERNAKQYLNDYNIPQMFESLVAALMIEKPEDSMNYLDSKLEEIKEKGLDNVNWETFVHHLHPLRSPSRLAVIAEELKTRKRREDLAMYEHGDLPDSKDDYQPDVFSLTEAQDD